MSSEFGNRDLFQNYCRWWRAEATEMMEFVRWRDFNACGGAAVAAGWIETASAVYLFSFCVHEMTYRFVPGMFVLAVVFPDASATIAILQIHIRIVHCPSQVWLVISSCWWSRRVCVVCMFVLISCIRPWCWICCRCELFGELVVQLMVWQVWNARGCDGVHTAAVSFC